MDLLSFGHIRKQIEKNESFELEYFCSLLNDLCELSIDHIFVYENNLATNITNDFMKKEIELCYLIEKVLTIFCDKHGFDELANFIDLDNLNKLIFTKHVSIYPNIIKVLFSWSSIMLKNNNFREKFNRLNCLSFYFVSFHKIIIEEKLQYGCVTYDDIQFNKASSACRDNLTHNDISNILLNLMDQGATLAPKSIEDSIDQHSLIRLKYEVIKRIYDIVSIEDDPLNYFSTENVYREYHGSFYKKDDTIRTVIERIMTTSTQVVKYSITTDDLSVPFDYDKIDRIIEESENCSINIRLIHSPYESDCFYDIRSLSVNFVLFKSLNALSNMSVNKTLYSIDLMIDKLNATQKKTIVYYNQYYIKLLVHIMHVKHLNNFDEKLFTIVLKKILGNSKAKLDVDDVIELFIDSIGQDDIGVCSIITDFIVKHKIIKSEKGIPDIFYDFLYYHKIYDRFVTNIESIIKSISIIDHKKFIDDYKINRYPSCKLNFDNIDDFFKYIKHIELRYKIQGWRRAYVVNDGIATILNKPAIEFPDEYTTYDIEYIHDPKSFETYSPVSFEIQRRIENGLVYI